MIWEYNVLSSGRFSDFAGRLTIGLISIGTSITFTLVVFQWSASHWRLSCKLLICSREFQACRLSGQRCEYACVLDGLAVFHVLSVVEHL